jgi:hypothetical protein
MILAEGRAFAGGKLLGSAMQSDDTIITVDKLTRGFAAATQPYPALQTLLNLPQTLLRLLLRLTFRDQGMTSLQALYMNATFVGSTPRWALLKLSNAFDSGAVS